MSELVNESVVKFGKYFRHNCPYCGKKDGNVAYNLWAFSIRAEHMDQLAQQGWCRSGNMLYIPIDSESCCRQHSLKLKVHNKTMQKSHRKIMRKLSRFLDGKWNAVSIQDQEKEQNLNNRLAISNLQNRLEEFIIFGLTRFADSRPEIILQADDFTVEDHQVMRNDSKEGDEIVRMTCSIPVIIFSEGLGFSCPSHLAEEIVSCAGPLPADLDVNIQVDDHGLILFTSVRPDNDLLVPVSESNEFGSKKRLVVTLERPRACKERYRVYYKYQGEIHGEEDDKLGFRRFKEFIVSSPLIPQNESEDTGFGTFHCCYRLEDLSHPEKPSKLIAFAVLDFLPTSLASLYFCWDPLYHRLSLGTYSILQELDLCQQRDINEYLLGFYVSNSPKMQYKLGFGPAEVFVESQKSWKTLENLTQDDVTAEECENDYFPHTRVLYQGMLIELEQLLEDYPRLVGLEKVKEYSRRVGKRLAEEMVYWME